MRLAALADYRSVCDNTLLLDTCNMYERDYSLCVTLLTSATDSASLHWVFGATCRICLRCSSPESGFPRSCMHLHCCQKGVKECSLSDNFVGLCSVDSFT